MAKFYLGIDYGTGSVGLAIGQDEIGTAQPLTAIKMRNRKLDPAQLEKVLREWQVSEIVLGLPVAQDNSELSVTKHAYKFGKWLAKTLGLPINLLDERNTSTSAREFLFSKYKSKGLSKDKIDATAAAVILQAFLDGEEPSEVIIPEQPQSYL